MSNVRYSYLIVLIGLVLGLGLYHPAMPAEAASAIVVNGSGLLDGIACPTSSTCIAVGQNSSSSGGVLVTITNGNPGSASSVSGVGQFYSIACPSSSTCFAVGQNNNDQGVVVPITNGSPGGVSTVSGTETLFGIACATSSVCYAVGFSGPNGVLTTITNGSPSAASPVPGTGELAAIACPSQVCFAVGGNSLGSSTQGLLVPLSSGSPSGNVVPVAGTSILGGIACLTNSSCFAVGQNAAGNQGVVVPVTNGNPGSASSISGTVGFDGVACGSANTCYAVGGSGSSGAVVTINNGSIGSASSVSGSTFLDAAGCASSGACFAVGVNGSSQGVVASLTGTVTIKAGPLNGIACPSSSTCIGVGGDLTGTQGVVVLITNGTQGSASAVPGTAFLTAVACPSSSTCFAVGGTSSSGGGSGVLVPISNGSPGSAMVVSGTSGLAGIACVDSNTCYAVGGTGSNGVVVPISNGSPGSAITVSTIGAIDSSAALSGIACASSPQANTCYAVGHNSGGFGVVGDNGFGIVVPIANGRPGSAAQVSASGLDRIACPSSTCYAVGYNYPTSSFGTTSTTTVGVVVPVTNGSPGGASTVAGAQNLNDIACTDSNTCFAVGANGSKQGLVVQVTSGRAGSANPVSGTASLNGVACNGVCYGDGADSSGSGAVVLIGSSSCGAPTVTYAGGSAGAFYLVGAPSGTLLSAAEVLYTLQPADTHYETLFPPSIYPLQGGVGYWAFVPANTNVSVNLPCVTAQTMTISVPVTDTGPFMIGDPFDVPVTVNAPGATIYAYSPTTGYVSATTLQPGQGAWVVSLNPGASVTLTP